MLVFIIETYDIFDNKNNINRIDNELIMLIFPKSRIIGKLENIFINMKIFYSILLENY